MANPLFDALFGKHRASGARFLTTGKDDLRYAGFVDAILRAACVLRDQGLGPGDRLILQADKSPDALAVYGACVAAGVIFVPLNTAYTAGELDYFVGDAAPGLVICDPAAADRTSSIAARHGARILTLGTDGEGSFAAAMRAAPARFAIEDRAPGDLASVLYTSGTTGRSKGAMLTQGNLLSNARALVESWRITETDVLLHALPIFHTHGLYVGVNTTLLAGAAMIFQPGFDLDAVLEALPRSTTMMGVPTFYTRMLADPRLDRDRAAHMRLFVSGSAPLPAEVHRRFEERTGQRILERYGMSETCMNASNPYAGERRPGTVGFPLPGVELRITRSGAPVAAGETGGIEVRGPNVFDGYWQMPDKTAAELSPDGWFTTGDLGRTDSDGYLEIVGREKDLIISGGYNVYPKEVETFLDACPGVVESAVIGAPHPDFGEAVVAVLVTLKDANLDAVAAAAREGLANYKRPKRMVVAEALPRNTMGKVQKAALRDANAGLFSQAE